MSSEILEFVKEYPLENLKVWEQNPRKNDSASEKLAKFIERYGFVNPIVVDQNGIIRAGHTRLKSAKQLGKTHVPVLIVKFDSNADAIGYAIADNKASEYSEWDEEKLKIVLDDLKAEDFDLDLTGFGELEESESIPQEPTNLTDETKKQEKPFIHITLEDIDDVDRIMEKLRPILKDFRHYVNVNGGQI
jgi:ParB-like chromosome segregation protein Spo0J